MKGYQAIFNVLIIAMPTPQVFFNIETRVSIFLIQPPTGCCDRFKVVSARFNGLFVRRDGAVLVAGFLEWTSSIIKDDHIIREDSGRSA